jgi:drug/metabolite transporter (DMT)-like permease
MTAPQITPKSWLMIATLGLTWGATFLVIEVALRGITPFWLAAGRIGFAAALMSVIWGLRGAPLFTGPARDWTVLVFVALLSSALPFMLLSWGQQYVTSGFAGVSMAAVALIVLPLAHFLVPGEAMTLRKSVGFVIGFAGVVVLIGGQAFESSGALLETWGRLACLGAASCYAVSSVYLRRLPPIDPIGLATVLLLIGAVIVVPLAWFVEGPPPLPPTDTLLWLAGLGLIPTAAANILRVIVVRSAGPVFMSLVNYQVPVWSVLLGAAFLGEPLPPSLLWAMALILSGVALSQLGALRRLFGPRITGRLRKIR